jgi:hypothetical protein
MVVSIKGANKTPTFVFLMASKTLESALDCDHECKTAMALMPDRSWTPDLTFCKQPEVVHDAELQEFFATVKRVVLDGVSQIPVAERVHVPCILAPIARHVAPVKDTA